MHICVCDTDANWASCERELSNVLPVRGTARHTSPTHFETRGIRGELSEQPIHAIPCLIKTWHIIRLISFFLFLCVPSLLHLRNMGGVEGLSVMFTECVFNRDTVEGVVHPSELQKEILRAF